MSGSIAGELTHFVMQQAHYTLSDWLQILLEGDNQMESSIELHSLH